MARRLFLSAGHSNLVGQKDVGASGVKGPDGKPFIEGVLAVEFVELLKAELLNIGITPIVDKYSNILVETMASFKPLVGKKDLAIEIHWNAGPPAATGVEVILPGRAGLNESSEYERIVSARVADLYATTLGIKNRGAKAEKDTARKTLGWMRIPCENILIETCFISNAQDMANYQAYKRTLAMKLASYLKTIL